jgi:hypothetical protein
MEFTAMDALAYRSLGADEYAQRRSEVVAVAKEMPADFTAEQARNAGQCGPACCHPALTHRSHASRPARPRPPVTRVTGHARFRA